MFSQLLKKTNKSKDEQQQPLLPLGINQVSDELEDLEDNFIAYQPPVFSSPDEKRENGNDHLNGHAKDNEVKVSSHYAAVFTVSVDPKLKTVTRVIPDDILYSYIRDTSVKLVEEFLVDRLDEPNCFFKCFNTCSEPNEVERARQLLFLLNIYDELYEPTDTIIHFIKTGNVKGAPGESSFDSLSLRGIFINRFIPYYTKFHGEDWLRAAWIRQGNWINDEEHSLDHEALKELVHKEIDTIITRLEARKEVLENQISRFPHSARLLDNQAELRNLVLQLHELAPDQYAKPEPMRYG